MNMHEYKTFLLAGAVSAVLIACSSQPETNAFDVEAGASPPPQAIDSKPEVGTTASARTLPDNVARLFSRMDAVGPGSQDAYDTELKAFLRSPSPLATLKSVYRQLPATALGARWKTIHAASQVRSPEAVSFLSEVALSPAEAGASEPGHDAGDRSFRLRYTASVGIVKNLLGKVDGAEGATERLLHDADREVAQLVGVELFSEGRLSDHWKGVLKARGISSEFKRLEGAELEATRSVGPGRPHQGADVRRRPRSTSVPAIRETE
jgi:hypothetical protein